jgi:hypothetical protein
MLDLSGVVGGIAKAPLSETDLNQAGGDTVSEQSQIPGLSTHAELTLWVVDEWRCELWLVDGAPSLRLFNHERLASEIRILPHPHHDAWALANRWKALVTERSRPID